VQRGIADDEFAADNNGVGSAGGGEAGELIEEAAGGLFTHFFAGIIYCSQFWLCDPGDGVVVEADDGDVFGNAEIIFDQCLEEDGGEEIICGEDAVGAAVHGCDLFGGADGGGFAEIVDDDELGVVGKAVVGECLLVSFEAAGVDVAGEVGGDMGDAAAALGGEVGRGFVAGTGVVDDDAGAVVEFFYAVEEHDGDAFFYEGVEVFEVGGVEGEAGDEAVDAFVEEVVGVGSFLAIGFGGVADDEIVPCFGGYFFDAGEDGTDELAFEFVDDDADGVGFLHPQVGGEAVRAVAHFARGVHDALARLYIYGGMVFQAAADGCGGEAQGFGDVIYGDVLFSCHVLMVGPETENKPFLQNSWCNRLQSQKWDLYLPAGRVAAAFIGLRTG
jgi:hypothetical protein